MKKGQYDYLYVDDAADILGSAFEFAMQDCGLSPENTSYYFVTSLCASFFESRNPRFVAGMSGQELAIQFIEPFWFDKPIPKRSDKNGYSMEYWSGWAVARYQFHSRLSFGYIFEKVSLKEILSMYPTYHEMSIERFFDAMDERMKDMKGLTKLAYLRKKKHLSQSQLARLANVSLRSIQLYAETTYQYIPAWIQIHS